MTFKLNDQVVLVEPSYSRTSPERRYNATVTKVGRKYVYVAVLDTDRQPWYLEKCGFNLDDGWENDSSGRYHSSNYRKRIVTEELLAAEDRRKKVEKALSDAGLRFDWGKQRALSTDQQERLLAILQEET